MSGATDPQEKQHRAEILLLFVWLGVLSPATKALQEQQSPKQAAVAVSRARLG
jgi:hypothetical protein